MNTITKFCKHCNTETVHYVHPSSKRCQICAKESAKRAKERLKAGGEVAKTYKKTKAIKAINPTPRRDYDIMRAPVYQGEKWVNARGVMAESKPYVGCV